MKNFQKEYAAYTASEKKVNEIYHRIAVQMDAPDSVLWTLYCLCDGETQHTQNSIAQILSVPKQTINSAVSKLLKDGYVYLQQLPVGKNNKQILLTEKGVALCAEKIAPVIHAEDRAFNRLSEDEQKIYLSVGMKHNQFMLEELQVLLLAKRGEDI